MINNPAFPMSSDPALNQANSVLFAIMKELSQESIDLRMEKLVAYWRSGVQP